MEAFAIRDLREHTGELVRNAESGELSISSGARLAGMPYARYLQHLGAIGYCLLDEAAPLDDELALLKVVWSCRRQLLTVLPDAAIVQLDAAYAMGLGSGEAALLSYAAQHKRIALIDERRARRIAQRLNVRVVSSGTVLLALKSEGLIASVRPALAAWQAHGYYLSPKLQAELLDRAGELAGRKKLRP